MKYVIKMEYRTGNSFGLREEVGYIELSWENLDIAKENLKRIQEHYLYYRELNNHYLYRKEDLTQVKEEAKTKPWYCGKSESPYLSDEANSEWHVMLKLDDGSDFKYYTSMWCGYFERLIAAEIVPEPFQDSEMRISF